MGNQTKEYRINSRESRKRLQVTNKPYFRLIGPRTHLGYRKNKKNPCWLVRVYDPSEQGYVTKNIGFADDIQEADGEMILDYAQAEAKAQEMARHFILSGADSFPVKTVADAMAYYFAHRQGPARSIQEDQWRSERLILPILGKVVIMELTTDQITEWRNQVAKTPAKLRTKPGRVQRFRDDDPQDPEVIRRRQATANRTLTVLKAGLNHAFQKGKIGTDIEWRRVKPFKDADSARLVYLKSDQAIRLINACPDDFRPVVQGALYTGCRYGELTALDCGDFNPQAHSLLIRTSKNGKARHVILSDEGAAFFLAQTAGRSNEEPLFLRSDGERWAKDHQHRPIKAACKLARIRPAINFHALRHTYASLSVMNGMPLMVLAKNLGHTSTRMVEKHYGHLSDEYLRQSIKSAAPAFGFSSNIVSR